MIFNYFAKAYCINLQERVDRREFALAQFKLVGINNVTLVNAIKPNHKYIFKRKGAHGCYLSHLKVYEQAKNERLERFIVFEDDVTFSGKFLTDIQSILVDLKKVEWDIFYFHSPRKGSHDLKGDRGAIIKEYDSGLVKTTGSIYTHAMAINGCCLNELIKKLAPSYLCKSPIDIRALDKAISNLKLNFFACSSDLTYQNPELPSSIKIHSFDEQLNRPVVKDGERCIAEHLKYGLKFLPKSAFFPALKIKHLISKKFKSLIRTIAKSVRWFGSNLTYSLGFARYALDLSRRRMHADGRSIEVWILHQTISLRLFKAYKKLYPDIDVYALYHPNDCGGGPRISPLVLEREHIKVLNRNNYLSLIDSVLPFKLPIRLRVSSMNFDCLVPKHPAVQRVFYDDGLASLMKITRIRECLPSPIPDFVTWQFTEDLSGATMVRRVPLDKFFFDKQSPSTSNLVHVIFLESKGMNFAAAYDFIRNLPEYSEGVKSYMPHPSPHKRWTEAPDDLAQFQVSYELAEEYIINSAYNRTIIVSGVTSTLLFVLEMARQKVVDKKVSVAFFASGNVCLKGNERFIDREAEIQKLELEEFRHLLHTRYSDFLMGDFV